MLFHAVAGGRARCCSDAPLLCVAFPGSFAPASDARPCGGPGRRAAGPGKRPAVAPVYLANAGAVASQAKASPGSPVVAAISRSPSSSILHVARWPAVVDAESVVWSPTITRESVSQALSPVSRGVVCTEPLHHGRARVEPGVAGADGIAQVVGIRAGMVGLDIAHGIGSGAAKRTTPPCIVTTSPISCTYLIPKVTDVHSDGEASWAGVVEQSCTCQSEYKQ